MSVGPQVPGWGHQEEMYWTVGQKSAKEAGVQGWGLAHVSEIQGVSGAGQSKGPERDPALERAGEGTSPRTRDPNQRCPGPQPPDVWPGGQRGLSSAWSRPSSHGASLLALGGQDPRPSADQKHRYWQPSLRLPTSPGVGTQLPTDPDRQGWLGRLSPPGGHSQGTWGWE